MTFLIGLGGTGSKFVEHCFEMDVDIIQGLTIDNTLRDPEAPAYKNLRHLQLIDPGLQLADVVARGVQLSLDSDDSQTRLKDLASWRPNTLLPIPLVLGAGRIRSIGRSIAIAQSEKLRNSINETLSRLMVGSPGHIVIASSTDGGTGSSLIQDVVEICQRHPYENKRITVVLLDSLVIGEIDAGFSATSFRTLSEVFSFPLRSSSLTKENVNFLIVQTDGSRQIEDAAKEIFPFKYLVFDNDRHHRISKNFGEIERESSSGSNCLESALRRSASRVFNSIRDFEQLRGMSSWAMGRTRPLLECLPMSDDQLQRYVLGWLSLASRGLIKINSGNVELSENDKVHVIPLLRPSTDNPIDALPLALEAISLFQFLEREDPMTFAAVQYLSSSGETLNPSPENWSKEDTESATPARNLGLALAEHYGRLAVQPVVKSRYSAGSNDQQIEFVFEQLRLAQEFMQEPYNGSECVSSEGYVTPDSTLFRDISQLYVDTCQEVISQVEEVVAQRALESALHAPTLPSTKTTKRRLSRKVYTKPGLWIRFGVPAVLAAISIGGTIFFLSSSELRSIWAETATAVGGIMGSVAVCLGAVALIWSIQNSSVETARTDRLFTACLGVQESVNMLRIALQNAHATNESGAIGAELWNHQTLRLAAYLLGTRITEALDAGLFGLLSSIDEDNDAANSSPMSSASRRVFVLLDDLVRVSPEIISEREVFIAQKPAEPERVLQLAEDLRNLLEPVQYRYMADTLRRTPSAV